MSRFERIVLVVLAVFLFNSRAVEAGERATLRPDEARGWKRQDASPPVGPREWWAS